MDIFNNPDDNNVLYAENSNGMSITKHTTCRVDYPRRCCSMSFGNAVMTTVDWAASTRHLLFSFAEIKYGEAIRKNNRYILKISLHFQIKWSNEGHYIKILDYFSS